MIHNKIRQLKLRALPVNNSLAVGENEVVIEDRLVKGYLLVWGIPDSYGTVFLRGCCAKSLNDRGPQSNAKYKITFLNQHCQADPLGQFTVLEEDDYGLYFEAQVDPVADLDRVLIQLRSGTLNQFSIGFNYIWDQVVFDEQTENLLLKEIELYEGSVVTIGSQSETYAIRTGTGSTVEEEIEQLNEDMESFIKKIPRSNQLELRQLITRQLTLAKARPDETRTKPPGDTKPVTVVGWEVLSNLNLFE